MEKEEVLAAFRRSKQGVKARLSSLGERMSEQARICKAVKIERVPKVVTGILRVLENHDMLGRNLIVVGTNALYAYEASAGVLFEPSISATEDMDILLRCIINRDAAIGVNFPPTREIRNHHATTG